MCSILGIINKSGSEIDETLIKSFPSLLNLSKKRGPDSTNYFLIKPNIILGSNRLAIMDLNNGDMPMFSSDKRYVIAFNGEIYNYKVLKSELVSLGFTFLTQTDTEVVLNGFIAWGEEVIEKLNGMFAFAIWDNLEKRLLLGRDRFGIKPLFIFENQNYLIFSSDFKPFLHIPFIKKELNKSSLTSFMLLRFVVGPETMIENVKRLNLAEKLSWQMGEKKSKTKIYWQPKFNIDLDSNPKNLTNVLRTKYKKAIEMMLMGNSTPAVLLSGGIDSSSILAMMKEVGIKEIKTFSCTYKGSTQENQASQENLSFTNTNFNEIHQAEFASNFYKTNHSVVVIKEEDIKNHFDAMLYDLGEPHGSTDAFGHYFLAKEMKNQTKVALAGIGADEIFGGYINLYFGPNGKLLTPNLSSEDYLLLFSNLDNKGSDPTQFLSPSYCSKKYIFEYLRKKLSLFPKKTYPNELVNEHLCFELFTDLCGWELDQADRVYMASSIEVRPVFLENDLFDFSVTIPSKYKFLDGKEKWIFRESMKGILPKEIIDRKKFPSLGIPKNWYKKEWFQKRIDRIFKDPLPFWDFDALLNNKDDIDLMYRVVIFDSWYRLFF